MQCIKADFVRNVTGLLLSTLEYCDHCGNGITGMYEFRKFVVKMKQASPGLEKLEKGASTHDVSKITRHPKTQTKKVPYTVQ